MNENVFVRKRRNKYYVVLDYRDPETNIRKQKTLEVCEKSRDADKLLVEYKAKINSNTFIKPEKITLKEFMSQWIEQHKNNISITTYNRYKDIIDRHISVYLGDIELQKLSPIHIENFYNSLSNNLSGKTLLQYHRILHKILDKAFKMQLIPKNPADLVEAPKAKKYKAKILDLQQTQHLLQVAKNTRLEIPINLALILGLRAGEILGLKWDNVNFSNNTITIDTTLIRDKAKNKKNNFTFKEPKSETSNRVLTVPNELMLLLKEHKNKQGKHQLKSYGSYKNEFNLVFTKIDGQPMTSDSFSRLFRDFLKKHNLPLVRFHDLRHTNASLMLVSGTPMKVASTRLGHSSISITADLYTHVLQELDVEASEKLANIIYK